MNLLDRIWETLWATLFADGNLQCDETRVGVISKLKAGRDTLDSRGFKLMRTKTKYTECKLSKVTALIKGSKRNNSFILDH